AREVLNMQLNRRHAAHGLWIPTDWHFRSRFEAHCLRLLVHHSLVGRGTIERSMWPMQAKPSGVAVEFCLHRRRLEWDQDLPAAFSLHAAPETLDDGDGLVAPDSAPAGLDVEPFEPRSIILAELHAAVGDEVLRRPTRLLDGS